LITGLTDIHAELNRDPEQVRNEVISLANECGGGLLWIERVRVATSPRLDRSALLKRDDPFGEVLRILDSMRADASSLNQLDAIAELRKKLPSEIGEGSDPIAMDTPALTIALDEAEGLLLARLAATEAV
jgi:hypothetical protein